MGGMMRAGVGPQVHTSAHHPSHPDWQCGKQKHCRKVICMADLNSPKVQKILHSKAFAHLATIGPKGEPQSSTMWFLWDGEHIKFTHTTERQKYRNIKRD